MRKEIIRPLSFDLAPAELEDEIFLDIAWTKTYKISNLGRVKNIKKSSDKILLPYRLGFSFNFYVKINDRQCKIKELVYIAFFGEIPEGYEVKYLDGNFTNLDVKNLIAEPKNAKRRYTNPNPKPKPKKKPKKQIKRPKAITVELNEEDKEIQIKEMKKLKEEGYILSSSFGMIYKFRLKNTLCPL